MAMGGKLKKGCVQVYTGNGKGKTTAAAGLALRACGAGLSVYIGQFIKAKPSAEMNALAKAFKNAAVEQYGLGRFIMGEPKAEDVRAAKAGADSLRTALASGRFDLVIADEAIGAVAAGLLTEKDILSMLDARPENVELVVTGRGAPACLLEAADLVTEMKEHKHYFTKGVKARKGIEF